jgi:hypothetical protein
MSLIILFGEQPTPPAAAGYMPELLVEMDTADFIEYGFILDHPTKSLLDSGNTFDRVTTITWDQDITEYVRSGSTDRGASRELERTETGVGSLGVDNRDGTFTPFNAASPFFPHVLKKRVRIQAIWAGTTYPVFMGYVEAAPVTFPEDPDNIVTLQLVDGLKVLANIVISGSFPEQLTGQRIEAALLAAGFGATEMNIDLGVSTVAAATFENVNVLEHCQLMAQIEGGRFFASRIGQFVFFDRQPSGQPDLSTRTWADDGTGMSYRDVTFAFDDSLILNDVRLTREGGVEQVATDSVSQQHYGVYADPLPIPRTGLPLSSDAQVLDLAQRYVDRYHEPELRIEGLQDNAMQHRLWENVLPREMGDVGMVKESQTAIAQVSAVEGIRHDFDFQAKTWTVSLRVSPTVVENYARFDDPAFRLDDNFILGR